MGAHKRKPPLICAYCGATAPPGEMTRDHVPPRGIFLRPLPNDLITVPACRTCNSGASAADEAFRTFLGIRVGFSGGPGAALWRNGSLPSLMHNKKCRNELLNQMESVRIHSPSGLDLGHAYRVLWPKEAHDDVIIRITRGLYFHKFRERLGLKVPIKAYYLPLDTLPTLVDKLSPMRFESVGNGQFHFASTILPVAPKTSIWIYIFHRAHLAAAFSGPFQELTFDEALLAEGYEQPPSVCSEK